MPAPTSKAPRKRLSCSTIVDAAVRLADERGVDALTMRNLSSELRIQAMSLYSHFRNKDDLLTAITRRIMTELPVPSRRLAPESRLLAASRGLRRLGHAHPNIFPLLVLRPLPLDAALLATEITLSAFIDAGLSPRDAIHAQRTLLGFVRGYTLWEIGGFATGRRAVPGGPARASVLGEILATDPVAFATVHHHAELLMNVDPQRQFERSLRTIIRALIEPSPKPKRAPKTPR